MCNKNHSDHKLNYNRIDYLCPLWRFYVNLKKNPPSAGPIKGGVSIYESLFLIIPAYRNTLKPGEFTDIFITNIGMT